MAFVAVFATTLFLVCGKYNEKGQVNDSKGVATAMNIEKVTLDVQGMTCSVLPDETYVLLPTWKTPPSASRYAQRRG